MKALILAAITLLFAVNVLAQKFPFPQNVDYEYGYKSVNLDDANVLEEYNRWKANYFVSCNDTVARVDTKGITVSEGIGYGMLIMAYMGEYDNFIKLWNYYAQRTNEHGLMHWQYKGCSESPLSKNGATDADLDVAMALLVGTFQWPDKPELKTKFDILASNIRLYEFGEYYDYVTGITYNYQKKGDMYATQTCMNPSYFAPGYYRAFAKYYEAQNDTNVAAFWNKAAEDTYFTLSLNAHPNTGLVTAWTTIKGGVVSSACVNDAGGGGTTTDYQFDACRTPWRISLDYLWWGNVQSKMFLSKMVDFVKTPKTDQGGWYGAGGIGAVTSGYRHNGVSYNSFSSAPFTGGFALTGMSSSQEDVDEFMTTFAKIKGDNYFNTSIAVLYKLVASGNFWNPFAQENCQYPVVGADRSICNLADKTITATNISNDAVEKKWYVNGVATSNNGATIQADSAAFYTIEVTAPGCVTRATVRVSGELPQPAFASFETTCTSNKTLLTLPSQFDEQFKYYWTYEDNVIPQATSQSLLSQISGVYKVYVYTDECSPKSARAYISTTISEVDKPFSVVNKGASLTLSAKKATNVEWYSDAAGTNKIATGKSLTVSPTSDTVFYMKDLASICALSPAVIYLNSSYGDMDGDGTNDNEDECPLDPSKSLKGKCGCHVAETCVDCDGVAFGTAFRDSCNNCAGGKTGVVAITNPKDCVVDQQEVYSDPLVQIRSNPTKDYFIFVNNGDKQLSVAVYSCSHQLVGRFVMNAGQTVEFGNEYVSGSYLAVVTTESEAQLFKLIKE